MRGTTHLAVGTAVAVVGVSLAGIGLGSGIIWRRYHTVFTHSGSLSVPDLHPVAWLSLLLAAGLGSLLPDIDQPGSLVTRLPQRESRAFGRVARRFGRGPAALPAGVAAAVVEAGGTLLGALLGQAVGRPAAPMRAALWLLSALCLAFFAIARWLPPPRLLTIPVQGRHLLGLALASIAVAAAVMALGGIAGLVNRAPGHHRGWTHAPPVAAALTIASFGFGPLLFPALPGVGPAFAIGYVSHLAADALTIRGIPLCWPGAQAPGLHLLPRPFRVRTGSGGETVFNLCWLALLPAATFMLAR